MYARHKWDSFKSVKRKNENFSSLTLLLIAYYTQPIQLGSKDNLN